MSAIFSELGSKASVHVVGRIKGNALWLPSVECQIATKVKGNMEVYYAEMCTVKNFTISLLYRSTLESQAAAFQCNRNHLTN